MTINAIFMAIIKLLLFDRLDDSLYLPFLMFDDAKLGMFKTKNKRIASLSNFKYNLLESRNIPLKVLPPSNTSLQY